MKTIIFRLFLAAASAGILTGGPLGAVQAGQAEESAMVQADALVGVWMMRAIGAPFEAHIVTFHGDGTMIMSNPDAGNRSSSDSSGMGIWKTGAEAGSYIVRFAEVNADPNTGTFVSTLTVDISMTVTGDTFTGDAVTNYYRPDGSHLKGPVPASLDGKRVTFPDEAP